MLFCGSAALLWSPPGDFLTIQKKGHVGDLSSFGNEDASLFPHHHLSISSAIEFAFSCPLLGNRFELSKHRAQVLYLNEDELWEDGHWHFSHLEICTINFSAALQAVEKLLPIITISLRSSFTALCKGVLHPRGKEKPLFSFIRLRLHRYLD